MIENLIPKGSTSFAMVRAAIQQRLWSLRRTDQRHWHKPEAAGNAQDVPATLLSQQGQSRPKNPNHTKEICLKEVLNLVVVRFFYRRNQTAASVVDQNVQPAEVRKRLLHDLLRL